ncbi:MAG: glycosyltransferase family 2 protein [Gemmatimonadota bacterium]
MRPPDPGPVARRGGSRNDGVAALIPALNEEEALPGVLASLRALGIGRIVVVDNGSTDGTARVAREGGAEVVLEPRRGYGAACLAGMCHLALRPPEVLVFLDGDQSDDPAALDRLLAPIRSGKADLVVGIRTAPPSGGASAVPLHARMGNRLVLLGMRLLHGVRARDLGPFRAIRHSALVRLGMDDRDWGWTVQMQLRAHHLGIRVCEVEVPHRPRAAGRSKVSGSLSGSFRAGKKMLFTLIAERRRAGSGGN